MKIETASNKTDLFKAKFEKVVPIIKNQLKTDDIWRVEEFALKSFFNEDCDTNSLYDKMRYILKDTDLQIKIEKNKIINGKRTNLFGFYTLDKINNLKKKEDKIDKTSIEIENEKKEKEKVKNMVHEDIDKIRNKSKEVINDIPTDIPLPYTVICLSCKKKIILKRPELNCSNCGDKILEKW